MLPRVDCACRWSIHLLNHRPNWRLQKPTLDVRLLELISVDPLNCSSFFFLKESIESLLFVVLPIRVDSH